MRLKDILVAVLIALIWGFNFTAVKLGLQEFPPIFFSVLRFSLVLLPAIFFVKRKNIPWKIILAYGFIFGIMQLNLFFLGMYNGMPAGLASVVLQSQAIFTPVFAVFFFKEKPGLLKWLGILIAFSGMLFAGIGVHGDFTLIGFGLIVLSAACWSLGTILMKYAGEVDMFSLIIWSGLVPIVPNILVSLLIEHDQVSSFMNMGLQGFGAWIYVSFFATILGFGLWGNLLKKYPASTVAPFSLMVPIFGILFSVLIFGEVFTPAKIIASLLVMIGILLVVFDKSILKSWQLVGRIQDSEVN